MRFVADESIDAPIVETLRQGGHEVAFVTELDPGIEDDEVLALSNDRRAVLLTADKDFGELVFRLGRVMVGVVLVRLPGQPPRRKARIVMDCIERYGRKMVDAFTVIGPRGVRIRDASNIPDRER